MENDESLLELLQVFLNTDRTNQYLAWISWTASIRAEIHNVEKPDAFEGEVVRRPGVLPQVTNNRAANHVLRALD